MGCSLDHVNRREGGLRGYEGNELLRHNCEGQQKVAITGGESWVMEGVGFTYCCDLGKGGARQGPPDGMHANMCFWTPHLGLAEDGVLSVVR